MIVKVKVFDLTQEDLVDLLATGLYDNPYLWADYSKKEYDALPDSDREDTFEDKLAKLLLHGKSIDLCDKGAEGETYGLLPSRTDGDDVIYRVSLRDVKLGLEEAINGDFIGDAQDKKAGASSFLAFEQRYTEGNWDFAAAYTLLQIICFREIIYA